jgi:dedicator of cytokinesis protein 3
MTQEPTVEKTLYTTAETFPTILRRCEIVAVGNITLSPLQAAIERTARKTVELMAVEKRIVDGDDTAFNGLTQELMYAVDTNADSCVASYHELLPPLQDPEEEETSDEQITNPLENALRVGLIDYALVIRRCLALYVRPAQQATKADLGYRTSTLIDRRNLG